jgi:hypothetical protein
MVKLLHLADVHLGGRLHVAADALIRRVRAATRTALRRAVEGALHEEVDAVIVAGNLFDARHLGYDAEQFLTGQLARLDEAGVPCFYTAGPADPAGTPARETPLDGPASLHHFDAPAPEGALLTADDGRPLARVIGAGVGDPAADAVPSGPFPDPGDDLPHIGLLHAALPENGERAPAPFRRAQPKNGRYAYWALGGAPRHQPVPDAEERAWYAGPTAPRGPQQAGMQGGLLVALGAGQPPQVTFRSFAPLCWVDLTLDDLEGVSTQHALLRQAERALETARPERAAPAYLARFTLTGGCPLAPSLREPEARRRLEAALAAHLDVEAAFVRLRHLTPPARPGRHRDDPHVLREALALIDRAAEDPALLRELAPGVLAAAPPPGEEDAPERYLREHLAALDREACARLLRDAQDT